MALDLLYALNQIAIELQKSIQSEEEIYEIFNELVVSLGLRGGISVLDEQRQTLVFKTIGMTSPLKKLLSKFETETKTRAKGYTIKVEAVDIYNKVISERESIFVEDTSIVSYQVVPKHLRVEISPLMKMLGNTPGVYAPLIYAGKVRGILNIAGPDLEEKDVPVIRAFAIQIAVALENASLSMKLRSTEENIKEQVQERTEYLNKLVMMMSGREVRMAELKKVIKKLRKQLKEAGIEPIADDPLNEPIADE